MKYGPESREKVEGTPGLYRRLTATGEVRFEYQWRDVSGKIKKSTLAASNVRHARREAIVLRAQAVTAREEAKGLLRDPQRDRGIVLPGIEEGIVYVGVWAANVVKIGWTRRPDITKRLSEIGCDLLVCFPGRKTDESRLHHRFEAQRLAGHSEFFYVEGALGAWLEGMLGPLRYDITRYGVSDVMPRRAETG